MKNKILILAIGLLLFNCKKTSKMSGVQSIQEIRKNKGKEVTVVGTYKPVSLNQKEGIVEYTGHYKIEVNDTLSVLLLPPYDSKSKRSSEEVQKLEGKKVKVYGIITDKTYMEPPTIENEPLTLSLPCFTEIKSIQLDE